MWRYLLCAWPRCDDLLQSRIQALKVTYSTDSTMLLWLPSTVLRNLRVDAGPRLSVTDRPKQFHVRELGTPVTPSPVALASRLLQG